MRKYKFKSALPAFDVTTKEDQIKRLNLRSYEAFLDTLKKNGITLSDFAYHASNTDILRDLDALHDDDIFYERLPYCFKSKELQNCAKAFRQVYHEFDNKYHIRLYIDYHNQEENGDIFDEVNGVFFVLDFQDVYTLTEPAKKLQEKIDFKLSSFVIYDNV